MIHDDIAVHFSEATKQEKQIIKEIIVANYLKYVDSFMNDKADYVTVNGYFKNHTPLSKKIMSPKEFIRKYGVEIKPKK